jgi:hypothetical protein
MDWTTPAWSVPPAAVLELSSAISTAPVAVCGVQCRALDATARSTRITG